VTTLADDGAGSLRAAITQANTAPDLDTIEFAPTVTGQITLLSALPDLSTNMIITGPGASMLDVSRTDAPNALSFGILHVTAGANVAISGLTISNGSTGMGGGLYNEGKLTITSSMIRDNEAGSGAGLYNIGTLVLVDSTIRDNTSLLEGGGIRNYAGTLTVAHCILTGNTASYGGAIENVGGITSYSTPIIPGIATITDCVISENSASMGGGIFNSDFTSLQVLDTTISGNTSVASGGGVEIAGTATFTRVTVSGNRASRTGGGFDHKSGTLTIEDSAISNNQAPYGGAINQTSGVPRATMNIVNSTLAGNTAGGTGGAINLYGGGVASITDSTIADNVGGYGGGGISCYGTLNIETTIFANNAGGSLAVFDAGAVVSSGHNLFSDTPAVTLNSTDLVNTDPLLGPLADNGGPTRTMALLPGSPAIDSGTEITGITTDQRGITRPQGSAPDIGAFESRGFSINLSAGNGQSALIGTPFTSPLVVNVSSPYGEPVAGGVVNFNAPTNGPSADLSSGSVAIGDNGQASINAVANEQIGSYRITTHSGDLIGPAFMLTNLATPPPIPPAPIVTALQRFGVHSQPTLIVVRFSRSMDAGRANNLGNYRLVTAGRDGIFGTKDDRVIRLRSSRYDNATHSVRLAPIRRLPLSQTYQLTINGTSPDGLTGTDGVFLGGEGRDRPGTNYATTFNRSALVIPPPVDRVHHLRARRVHHQG
jgi:hypothetical protein